MRSMTDPKPSETDAEFRERISASLERHDAASRVERVERLVCLSQYHPPIGLIFDRPETSMVLEEARASFVYGNNVATLILALAYVEHALADSLPSLPEPLPGKKKARSPMIMEAIDLARAADLFPADLLDRAEALCALRNPFVHRRDEDDPDTLGHRIWTIKAHFRTILEQDARDALAVMYGFFRHSLTLLP